MSWIAPPQNEVGNPLTFINPSTLGTSVPAAAFQVSNASPYVVTVQAIANNIQIQPYTAVTVPVSKDQNIIINPGLLVYPSFTIIGYVAGQWLEAGEQPNVPDGPLTAAAQIASAIGTSPQFLGQFSPVSGSLAAGATFSILNGQINTVGILSFLVVVAGSNAPGPTNTCVLVQGPLTITGAISPQAVSGDVCYINGNLAGQYGMCVIDCLNVDDTNPNIPVINITNLGSPTSQALNNGLDFGIYGFPFPAEQLRNQIKKTSPAIVVNKVLAAGQAGITVMPAPPSASGAVVPQTVNQLLFTHIQGGTAVANASAGYLFGPTSGAYYLLGFSTANGIVEHETYPDTCISEGLSATNSTAVSVAFTVGYRILAAQTT